jgi:TolB-like protein/Tfp pilus assembly protein PilF
MSFFAELKRRNVIRVGVAYGVAFWLLMQIVGVLTPVFELPGWAPKLIFLILAVGFIPVVIFAWAFELTPDGIKRESEVNRTESITNVTAKKLDYITIGLVVGAVLIVAVDRFLPGKETATTPQSAAGAAGSEAVSVKGRSAAESGNQRADMENVVKAKSIAVLPFVNMSSDPEQEFFSDGISEEILNALAKVKELKVAGRTSSFAFKGENQDLRKIGEALGVANILEGSVRKSGNKVRITAQLIQVEDGFHLWSETYDRELTDIFAIQDEISATILQQLKAKLIGEEAVSVARADTRAYDLYLLASQRIYERNQASLQMASDLLNQAIAIDPGYAPAYAQLGIATLLLSAEAYGNMPKQESGKTALNFLQKSLALDPKNADALAGMGLYHLNIDTDYTAATEVLEQSVAINPSLINASLWLGTAYGATGNLRRSLQIQEESYAIDPLHPAVYNNLATTYAAAGMSEKALAVLADLDRYVPNDAGRFATVGKVQVMLGNWAEGDRALTGAVERTPENFVDRLWLSAVLLGLSEYERLAEIGADGFRSLALSRLGRTEEALMLAREVAAENSDMNRFFNVLVENGRHAELVEFVETRWPDLDAFQQEFPGGDGYGDAEWSFLALAYGRVNQEEKFKEVMSRYKAGLDRQLEMGADNWVLNWSRAHYALLSGDPGAAIALLDKAVQQGAIFDDALGGTWSIFSSLRGDPAFEAVRVKMLEHLNTERAELGLEPLST